MTHSSTAMAELKTLAQHFGDKTSVAEILAADKSRMTRWMQGEDSPSPENEERIAALRFLALRLARVFRPKVALDWLQGINGFLGNQRPVDLIRHGRISEVLAAIEQTDAGSYV